MREYSKTEKIVTLVLALIFTVVVAYFGSDSFTSEEMGWMFVAAFGFLAVYGILAFIVFLFGQYRLEKGKKGFITTTLRSSIFILYALAWFNVLIMLMIFFSSLND